MNHLKGHLRIIACPGSGKTEVVSNRVAMLIKSGVSPKTIVAFTFTEKAAGELKSRIRDILQRECPERSDFGDMFVGTIHSFCFFMLKELDPVFRSFDVLDDAKRIAFLSKGKNFYEVLGLADIGDNTGDRFYRTIKKFVESCDIIMTSDIDPAKLSNSMLKKSYVAYRDALTREKYFDFSSIIHTFVKTVTKNPKKARLLGDRVKHVIVDEYQDVNTIQEMLIEILSRKADSVCVVGDDDQNIYHWRGSDVGIIREFHRRYENFPITDVVLDTNFRSTDAVIHTCRQFIENNTLRIQKNMKSNPGLTRRYENGDLHYQHFPSDEEEFGFIADKIAELHGSDFIDKRNRAFSLSYSDFAVLVRTNEDASSIVDFLDTRGIPCISHSGTSIFERPIILLAMDCLAYLFGCNGYRRETTPELSEINLRYSEIFDPSVFPESSRRSFSTKMRAIKSEVDDLMKRSPKDYFGDLGLQGFYFKILSAMGAEKFDFGEILNYNLAALSKAISDYESVWVRLRASEVEGFFYFVYAFARSYYMDSHHNDPSILDAVHVITIHRAKGLEFPAVFIPNFEKRRRRPPSHPLVDTSLFDFERYSGNEEDERRVYYTAMTRSEKYLFITGSILQSNRRIPYKPHDFVGNLDMKFFNRTPNRSRKRSGLPSRVRSGGTYPTSFSNLECFGRCPHEFRMRHVYQYNAGVPVTFGYGSNVHNLLNTIHASYIVKKKIPATSEIRKLLNTMFVLRYATDKIARNMKKAALRIVLNYVKLHEGEFNRILETEKKFEFVLRDALISGQIDLLKRVDEKGRITEVEIIDFKTDRNDSIYQGDYDKQLRFYAIACLESLGLNPQRAYVHHLDQNKKSYVDISKGVLSDTKSEINTQIGSIMQRQFPPKPDPRICTECDYRVICSKKK